jgi:hypothetical protein
MRYQTEAMANGVLPTAEEQAAIGAYIQEVAMAGVRLDGEGVAPSSARARLEGHGRECARHRRPVRRAKELIADFAILEVGSLAEAVRHARRSALLVGAERVDVRRVIEFSDLRQPQ